MKLLLDGQQRITTLYMLINGKIPPYYTLPEITNETRGLYVNVETLELLYYMKRRMENNPAWQNITNIFQGKVSAFDLQAKYLEAGRTLAMEDLKKLNDNINAVTRIKEREFPEQTIPIRANVREAIDIFYKVNASGVPLTDAELALAQISGTGRRRDTVLNPSSPLWKKRGSSLNWTLLFMFCLAACTTWALIRESCTMLKIMQNFDLPGNFLKD